MAELAGASAFTPTRSIDFAIKLEFERNSEDPSRIFRTMTGLIEACEIIDNDLAASISIRVKPVLVLEDIQAESLTAGLKYLLKSVDDEALKSLDWKKAVGAYLVKGKRRLVEFLEGRSTIERATEIYKLQGILGEAADEAGLTLISLTSPVPARRVAEDLRLLSDATTPLIPGDGAQFVTDEGPVSINTSFRVTAEAIEQILTQESITNHADMILMVKKPDFLGDSMWEFRHEGKRIPAKVVDTDWLENFHRGAIALRSGDALRAFVEIETHYGIDREVLGTHYRILKVQELIPGVG
jgi:hypothetical protein